MNVVPLSQLDAAVHEALVQIHNGLVRARRAGIDIESPPQVQFTIAVVRDEGLNAIARVSSQAVDGERVQTTEQGEGVTTDVKGAESSLSVQNKGEERVTDEALADEDSSETGYTNHGRTTAVTSTYEE